MQISGVPAAIANAASEMKAQETSQRASMAALSKAIESEKQSAAGLLAALGIGANLDVTG